MSTLIRVEDGLSYDLAVGPSDFMQALRERNPWLSEYQAALVTNLMLRKIAELIRQGGTLGVLMPSERPGEPKIFVAIQPIQTN